MQLGEVGAGEVVFLRKHDKHEGVAGLEVGVMVNDAVRSLADGGAAVPGNGDNKVGDEAVIFVEVLADGGECAVAYEVGHNDAAVAHFLLPSEPDGVEAFVETHIFVAGFAVVVASF